MAFFHHYARHAVRRTMIQSWSGWGRLMLGLGVVFAAFQSLATRWGSNRGEAGLLLAAVVLVLLVLVERWLFGRSWRGTLSRLGLGWPRPRGLWAAALVSLALLAFAVAAAQTWGLTLTLEAGWYRRVPGLFAQGGIAEEALFRGYLFGHLRVGRSFWRAASASTAPFVIVHLLLFLSMPWPVAAAAVLLALVLSFPLAWLFELSGGTIWGPALVHCIIQGTLKVVVVSHDVTAFAVVWMCASAAIPMLLFLVRPPDVRPAGVAIQTG